MPEAPRDNSSERTAAETLCTPPRMVSAACSDACLVHIYPSGPSMGKRYPLSATAAVLIGRGDDCAIHIDDNSVSRKHARVEPTAEGYSPRTSAAPTGRSSTTARSAATSSRDGDYLRVGNCIYRFLAGGNIEAEYHEEIYRLAIIDGLTDVPNKRYLIEFLGRELSRSVRHKRPLALHHLRHRQVQERSTTTAATSAATTCCATSPAGSRR